MLHQFLSKKKYVYKDKEWESYIKVLLISVIIGNLLIIFFTLQIICEYILLLKSEEIKS